MPKIRTALCLPSVKLSRLTIPGTHGTWSKRIDYSVSKTGAYIAVTRPTSQVLLTASWGLSYVEIDGKKVTVR